ncbi:glycosyltransferase [Verrucomicrobium sp. BvORR034]|uniref:glycosyltransferase n=1 Tax=Verrucomicrobium sp. BvORR034 TaxID=1396418 RepID=UPI000679D002|nr:glycosyltransferase [Verrucomicrobium sp. BvORR034]
MADRLRILQVVDSLEPGGMENVLAQMVSRMDPGKFEFEVCCLTRGGPFEARLPSGMPVHVLGKSPGFSWGTVTALRQLVRARGYDVVHTRHLGGLIYTTLACPRRGAPHLVHSEHTIWDGAELSSKRRWQRRFLYPRASAVFSVSQQQMDQMIAIGPGHRRLSRILNGVDCVRFAPAPDKEAVRRRLGLAPAGRWLGIVARFGAQKRHMDLLEAFDAMAAEHPEVHLLMVGDGGPEKGRVLQRMEQSPFRDRVVWAGFQQDPAPWYQALDVLVVSSSNEGLPNAVLEAMATGLPVVANDVCGVREIVRTPDHGWVGNYGTIPALAQGLTVAATASPQELLELGGNSRKHVEQFFSLDAMVNAYDALYSSLSGAGE